MGLVVFVAHNLLGVEIINPLIHGSVAAEAKAFSQGCKRVQQALAQAAIKYGGFCAAVIQEFTGFCANLHNFALFHN